MGKNPLRPGPVHGQNYVKSQAAEANNPIIPGYGKDDCAQMQHLPIFCRIAVDTREHLGGLFNLAARGAVTILKQSVGGQCSLAER